MAVGFINYEKLLISVYTGAVSPKNDGDISLTTALTASRANLTSNGVNSANLKTYENLLLAVQTGMVGAKYDGDNTFNTPLATQRAALVAAYTGV
jgi:hypothetical protein